MDRKGIILKILIAFIIGLVAGTTAVIVKKGRESKEPEISQTGSFPITKQPISIELTEKIEDLKETVRRNPRDLAAWVKLGEIFAEHHRYREAAEAYTQALSIQPNDSDIRTDLGLMLRVLGDDDGAIEEFKKAAQNDPKHGNSRYYLGLMLIRNRAKSQEGIKAWEDFLRVEPKGRRANEVRIEIERLRTETAEDNVKQSH